MDEGFHGRVPHPVEAEKVHFVHRLQRRPVIVSHTVGGDEDACTIIAKPAMDKHSFLLTSQLNISKDRKKLRDLFVAWRIPAADWDIDEVHA